MGKVIHWLRKYLNKQAVRWSIVVAIGADKSPTVCVAAAYQAATDALKKKKTKKKKLSAKLVFHLLVFFLHFFASFLFCLRRDWCNVKENLL